MRTAFWAGAAVVLFVAMASALVGPGRRATAAPEAAPEAAPGRAAAAEPLTGQPCNVFLRGDASGVAIHDRLPGLGNLIRLSGTITEADDRWLVLKESDGVQYRVPVTSVLTIEYGVARK